MLKLPILINLIGQVTTNNVAALAARTYEQVAAGTIVEVFSLQMTFFLPLRSSLLKLANISTLAYSELQRELLLKM